MDGLIRDVLEIYHTLIEKERSEPRVPRPEGWDGRPDRRLRAVGPQTGQLINILARSLSAPTLLDLGTSYGYSAIWLAEAARATGGRVISMELHGYKSAFARDMAAQAELLDHIDFRVGDAVKMVPELDSGIDFVLLDLWKDLYLPCLDAVVPKLTPGAILVADNIVSKAGATRDYVAAVRAIPGMASLTVPVGQGLEISRYRGG